MGVAEERSLPVDPDAASPFAVATGRPRNWDIVGAIAAGGALGGAARHLLSVGLPAEGFPWATLVENVTGCFLLGALMVFLLEVGRPSRYLRPFLGVGVLGGFTTFSAYTAETRGLLLAGRVPVALLYLFGSVLAGLLATWLGIALARTVLKEES
jgi:fluoride exporter